MNQLHRPLVGWLGVDEWMKVWSDGSQRRVPSKNMKKKDVKERKSATLKNYFSPLVWIIHFDTTFLLLSRFSFIIQTPVSLDLDKKNRRTAHTIRWSIQYNKMFGLSIHLRSIQMFRSHTHKCSSAKRFSPFSAIKLSIAVDWMGMLMMTPMMFNHASIDTINAIGPSFLYIYKYVCVWVCVFVWETDVYVQYDVLNGK